MPTVKPSLYRKIQDDIKKLPTRANNYINEVIIPVKKTERKLIEPILIQEATGAINRLKEDIKKNIIKYEEEGKLSSIQKKDLFETCNTKMKEVEKIIRDGAEEYNRNFLRETLFENFSPLQAIERIIAYFKRHHTPKNNVLSNKEKQAIQEDINFTKNFLLDFIVKENKKITPEEVKKLEQPFSLLSKTLKTESLTFGEFLSNLIMAVKSLFQEIFQNKSPLFQKIKNIGFFIDSTRSANKKNKGKSSVNPKPLF